MRVENIECRSLATIDSAADSFLRVSGDACEGEALNGTDADAVAPGGVAIAVRLL
jgi:hypothetical protein